MKLQKRIFVLLPWAFVILGLLRMAPVEAATKLVGYSNYFYTAEPVDATTVRIFAGSTRNQCVNTDLNKPCNSCASSNLSTQPFQSYFTGNVNRVCSEQEAYPSLRFSVTLSSDQGALYKSSCSRLIIGQFSNTNVSTLEVTPVQVSEGVANQDVTAVFDWASICNGGGGGSSCNVSWKNTFSVGFNKDCGDSELADGSVKFEIHYRYVEDSPAATPACDPNALQGLEGFCNFTAYPGDEKIFINTLGYEQGNGLKVPNFESAITAPFTQDGSQMIYKAARFYFVEGDGSTIQAASLSTASSPADINFSIAQGIASDSIRGLTNGTQYSLVMASVDQAGIATFFTDVTTLNYATDPIGETQSAIPEQVSGLLDGKKCFIATAAFGSELAPQVERLRQFRDQVLRKSSLGRSFIKTYYKHSPPLARWISEHEIAKVWVRSQLWLILLVAELILIVGWVPMFFSAVAVSVAILSWSQRSRDVIL